MPTYEYQCSNCGYEFEEFQPITAKPIRKCPQCSKGKLQRLIGCGAGVIFKGTGFYQTDYRSESYKQAAKAEEQTTSQTNNANANKGEGNTAKTDTTKVKPSVDR